MSDARLIAVRAWRRVGGGSRRTHHVAKRVAKSAGMQNISRFSDQLNTAREGSGEALGRLFNGCREYLLLVANCELERDVQPKVAPSDLVQETFLEAQHCFDRFTGSSEQELLRWLRRMLLNNLRDAARRYRRTQKAAVHREVPLDVARWGVDGNGLSSPDQTPQTLSVQNEELARVESALARLPDDQRQAVILRNFLLLPFAEIGSRLDRSGEAARKLWGRAMRTLQRQLRESDE